MRVDETMPAKRALSVVSTVSADFPLSHFLVCCHPACVSCTGLDVASFEEMSGLMIEVAPASISSSLSESSWVLWLRSEIVLLLVPFFEELGVDST